MPYNLPQRKSPRATWHDYNGGRYFVTFCTKNHDLYFGDVVDGRMELSEIGKWTAKQIEQTAVIRQNDVEIPMFVVMPNHVRLIVVYNRVVPCRDALNASACRDTSKLMCRTMFQRTHAVRPYGLDRNRGICRRWCVVSNPQSPNTPMNTTFRLHGNPVSMTISFVIGRK